MERELPEETFVLGVDEHTAVILDLDARTVTVAGNGGMTIRRHGHSVVHRTGAVVGFDALVAGSDAPAPTVAPAPADTQTSAPAPAEASLRAAADRLAERFAQALAERDVDGCVSAILDLEQSLIDWSADTLTSDEGDHARAVLRSMVVRLGELATIGARDPREVVGPYVAALLELRARARQNKDFASSDWIRDQLSTAGVEVRDTPSGAEWDPPPPPPTPR
jgi:hypothetical protein